MRNATGSIAAPLPVLLAALLSAAAAQAQTYDPGTESPLTLLSAPGDGVGYHLARSRARTLVAEEKFSEAEPLADRLTRDYPRDGENWILAARVRAKLNKHAEAAAAYERAGPLLGWGSPHHAGIYAAASHLAAGNRRAALDRLRRDVFENRGIRRPELFDWPALASLRSDPEFLEIVGRPITTGWTRDDGWRHDIDHLYEEVKRVNPDHRDGPLPDEFERRYQELKRRVPRLTDEEVYVGLLRMLAALRQGHTGIWPSAAGSGRIQERMLPVQLHAFPEGIFVVNATGEHRDLIGSRLLSIEGTPAEEVLRRVSETRSADGDMEHVLSGPISMAGVPLLMGLGIVRSAEVVRVTLQPPSAGPRTVSLATGAFAGMQQLQAAPGAPPPLFLRNLSEAHWELALAEHDALYVQVNQIRNDGTETLPRFGQRIGRLLSESGPGNVILDLRHNAGGSTVLYTELLRSLIVFSRGPGSRLYVLIGRQTYSAAANLITDLERLADPVFVGEASSECCNLHGDPVRVVLPYSRIPGGVSAVRWNLSREVFDGRREMSPHVPVQLTARAYFAGQDPALDAVFRLIATPP